MNAPEDNPADDVQPSEEEWDAYEAEYVRQEAELSQSRLSKGGYRHDLTGPDGEFFDFVLDVHRSTEEGESK
jgi:hypothetical protein